MQTLRVFCLLLPLNEDRRFYIFLITQGTHSKQLNLTKTKDQTPFE
ncbi:hypothetical protein Caka_1570 [Coraliomargarita akajimensis DSM 45221]|uniref:Uncharacterized protein n=1 Tax=Coraliomargarita akajimensis (strain DSM 45221 / IAM 15411 / JCM 23193 / KCTC 12865 / 04OKA010-24) TaxID=583355 RepID=D5EJJ0_CORAD|nr:hypothetical protein Caka_1570 [Coraliomargarita akajimensis DSM 45221]